MDALDLMFRRLVQTARAASPEYLVRPFEVAEIYHTLLPYRLNRRELGVESVQQYEATLMRLVAGERGYLTGDADMQRAMQEELQRPAPDTSAFRGFANAPVAFAPDALRQLERDPLSPRLSDSLRPPNAAARQAAPTLPQGAPAAAPVAAAPAPVPPQAPQAPAPTASVPPSEAPAAAAPARPAAPGGEGGEATATPLLAPMNVGVNIVGGSAGHAAGGATNCPYCAGKLPEGRDVTFCPHCGQNVTVRHCPACSTELEVGWRFCVTCGRNVEEVAAPRG